jgi:hypothetical protein
MKHMGLTDHLAFKTLRLISALKPKLACKVIFNNSDCTPKKTQHFTIHHHWHDSPLWP